MDPFTIKEIADVVSETSKNEIPDFKFEEKEESSFKINEDSDFYDLGDEIPKFEEKNLPINQDGIGQSEVSDRGPVENSAQFENSELSHSPNDVHSDLSLDGMHDAEDFDIKDVNEERATGGTYGDLKNQWKGELEKEPPHEIHHMPANDINGLALNDGPAIVMDKTDHRQTASCGNSLEAREYRAAQKELVENGDFEGAMQMDIDDIHDKFGDKYDEAIAQMKEKAHEKGLI